LKDVEVFYFLGKKKSQSFNWDSKVVVLGLTFINKLKKAMMNKFNKQRSYQIWLKIFDNQSSRAVLTVKNLRKRYSKKCFI